MDMKPYIGIRRGVGTLLRDPPDFPSKQHPCICGSGRKYRNCCKKAIAEAFKKKDKLAPVIANLIKWRQKMNLKHSINCGIVRR